MIARATNSPSTAPEIAQVNQRIFGHLVSTWAFATRTHWRIFIANDSFQQFPDPPRLQQAPEHSAE
jgi:hypothetical protein